LPPGEQPWRRDATIREESTPRRRGRNRFRKREYSRVPTTSIVFPLRKGDVPVTLVGKGY
jgi:hypothetical protein